MSEPTRKFLIKPFRPHSQMNKEQAQEIWTSLHAYNLVLHKHGDLLYEGVREAVYERLHSVAKLVALSPDDQLLNHICQQWRDHQVTMVMIRDILMYMDRTHNSLFNW